VGLFVGKIPAVSCIIMTNKLLQAQSSAPRGFFLSELWFF